MEKKNIEIFDFKRFFTSKLLFFSTRLSDNVIYYIVLRIISQASSCLDILRFTAGRRTAEMLRKLKDEITSERMMQRM